MKDKRVVSFPNKKIRKYDYISDGKYQPKGSYISKTEAKKEYYNNDYIDSKLRVISAALNELKDRIAALEGAQ